MIWGGADVTIIIEIKCTRNVMWLNHFETIPSPQPRSTEKLSSMKLVPGAKKLGEHWILEEMCCLKLGNKEGQRSWVGGISLGWIHLEGLGQDRQRHLSGGVKEDIVALYTQNLSWHSNLYNLLEYLSDNVGPNVSTVIERAP